MFLFVLIPVLILILITGTFVALTGQRFGRCLPAAILLVPLILYVSQFVFQTFFPGFFVILGLAILFPILYLFRKDRRTVRNNLMTLGLLSFVILVLLFLIIDFRRSFTVFDEWYHWGMMIKETLRLDRFYSVAESHLHIHKDYPPFITLLQLFFCKFARGYSEGIVTFAVHLLMFSLILPPLFDLLAPKLKIKTKKDIFAYVFFFHFIVFGFVLILDPTHLFNSILIDLPIAFVFAYAFLNIWLDGFFGKEILFSFFTFLLALLALFMLKQLGPGYLLLLDLAFLAKLILTRRGVFLASRVKSILLLCAANLIALGNQFFWNSYIRSLGITGQFDTKLFDLKTWFDGMTGRIDGLQHETFLNYVKALFSKNISSLSFLPITFASSLLLIFLILALRCRFSKKEDRVREAVLLGGVFTLGTIGYAAVMSCVYLFFFNPNEMAELASYNRYMASYVLGEILVLLVLLLTETVHKERGLLRPFPVVVFSLFLLVVNGTNLFSLAPQILRENEYSIYEERAAFLKSATGPNKSVFVIYDKDKTNANWYGPMQIYLNYYENDLDVDYRVKDAYAWDLSGEEEKEKLLSLICENDYLYLMHVNDALTSALIPYTDDMIQKGSVFVVDPDSDKPLKLKAVSP